MPGYLVVDVETSGTDPAVDRMLSLAALTLTPTGTIEHTFSTLLDAGVDPGPTSIHGLTSAMLAGQPRYRDIAAYLSTLLRGRTLVAHNVAFDYGFLAAESRRSSTGLPVSSVLCTVELAKLLQLDTARYNLAALTQLWGIDQIRPHDALDDAQVLAQVFRRMLRRAETLHVSLPLRAPHTLQSPVFSCCA